MPSRRVLAAACAAAALALAGCGGDDDDPIPIGEPEQSEQPATGPAEISTDLEEKPQIGRPAGEPPGELVTEDVVEGDGRAVREGDRVTVHYVGVNHSTGDQFDASWDNGEPVQFELARGSLIDGWVEGMQGMREGGRRMITIPPEQGYGAQGSPPAIPPNETLVFVIDLHEVERPR